MKKSKVLERALVKALEIEAEAEVLDGLSDGTVIKWKNKYMENGKFYTFAAIKFVGYWYTTKAFEGRLTSEELVTSSLMTEVKGLKVATGWETL